MEKEQAAREHAQARASFVIRLWLEPRENPGDPQWRWHVQQVQTGEQVYFHRLGDVLRYVELKSGQPSPS